MCGYELIPEWQQRMRPRNGWIQQLLRLRDWWMLQSKLRKQRQRPLRQLHCQRPKKHRSEWFDRHCGLLICARVSDCHGSLLLSNWRVVIPDICHIL